MGVAFVPLYIKYLGVEAYGLIGIFAILQSMLALLDMGMKPTLSREMARFSAGAYDSQSIRNLLRSVEIIVLAVAIAIALGVWCASHWLATDWVKSSLPVHEIQRSFTIMGVVAAFRFVESIYVSCLVGLQLQVIESLVGSSIAVARGLGAVGVLAWVSPTLEGFFAWQGLISFLTVPLLAIITYRFLPAAPRPGRFTSLAFRGTWRFAAGVSAITLLALLLTQIDKVLLSRLLPLKVFAYYTLAGALTGALYMLSAPICAAYFPKFTQLATTCESSALARAYHQAAQLATVVMGVAAVILIVFSDNVLFLWTENANLTQQVYPLLQVLTLGTLFNGLMGVPYQMQLAHGWTSLTIYINIVAVALFVPALFFVVPRYGAIGAAWIWVSLNAAYLVFDIFFMHRRLLIAEKWRWYSEDILLPLIAAGCVAIICRMCMPKEVSRLMDVCWLLGFSGIVTIAAALAAPYARSQLKEMVAGGISQVRQRF
jgi:O-antigen/teichoic acid export membrane protein